MMRTVILLAVFVAALLPGAALASDKNGELCAVQAWDDSIVVSVHRADNGPAHSATRQQVEHAAAWCTNQIASGAAKAASKYYDKWQGQTDVCAIWWSTLDTMMMVHASPDLQDITEAFNACRDIEGVGGHIDWWDGTNWVPD